MNSSVFIIEKTVLLKTLKEISKVLGKSPQRRKVTVLEITITDNKLTLVIPGTKYILDCETKNTVKATIGLLYFLDIINSQKENTINRMFTKDTLTIKGLSVEVETTFFETDKILRSIKMPINYSDWHLLRLEKEGFTEEEIKFNKLNYEVYCAKRKLKLNIIKAVNLLSIYGVNKKDIEEVIKNKIDF